MSVIPISHLSSSDLSHLGNNIRIAHRRRTASTQQRGQRRQIAAVNRSLAAVCERTTELHATAVVRR